MLPKRQIEYVQFYNYGSTAQKLELVAPQKVVSAELPKPRPQKRRKVYVDPVAIFGVIVAVCMFITIFIGMGQLRAAKDEMASMEIYVAYLQQENDSYQRQYRESYNLEDIEKTALALGMVPMAEASHSSIDMTEPTPEPEPTAWENFTTFLAGLFA